jgi:hypothetical protein
VTHVTRYAALLGKRVEAFYRAGDLQMSAIGLLAADNGKSISIEDRFSQYGRKKTLRVEIPYDYVIHVVEANGDPASPDDSPALR